MKKINKKNKLKEIALEMEQLENECQQGINISENIIKMEKIMMGLSLEDMLELTEILNKKFFFDILKIL